MDSKVSSRCTFRIKWLFFLLLIFIYSIQKAKITQEITIMITNTATTITISTAELSFNFNTNNNFIIIIKNTNISIASNFNLNVNRTPSIIKAKCNRKFLATIGITGTASVQLNHKTQFNTWSIGFRIWNVWQQILWKWQPRSKDRHSRKRCM